MWTPDTRLEHDRISGVHVIGFKQREGWEALDSLPFPGFKPLLERFETAALERNGVTVKITGPDGRRLEMAFWDFVTLMTRATVRPMME